MKHYKVLAAALLSGLLLSGCAASGRKNDAFNPEEVFQTVVCPADEALSWAESQPVVVRRDSDCSSGKEIWDAFYGSVQAGKPASVLCADYYTLDDQNIDPELYEAEKDQYPVLFFTLVKYDGSSFNYQCRCSSGETLDSEDTFKYLLYMPQELPDTAKHRHSDNYVLTDDDSVTWDQIIQSMISSQYDDSVRYHIVHTDYE